MILKVNNLENKIIDQKGYFKFFTTGKCKIQRVDFYKNQIETIFAIIFFVLYFFKDVINIIFIYDLKIK